VLKPNDLSFDKAYVGFLNENKFLEIEKLVKLIGNTTMKNLVNGHVSVSKVDDAKNLAQEIKTNISDKWGELEEGLRRESW
jgi:pyruvate/oxaloacetate carboxyltransferase